MKSMRLAGVLGGVVLAAGVTPRAVAAFPLEIDDFQGGPHIVTLSSVNPPEIATGSFAYAGAVGGVRDVFVISHTRGIFGAGVTFGNGGYSSFAGTGTGGILWDGISGATDKNNDGAVTLADDYDFGLSLDLVQDCPNSLIEVTAFADLPNASLGLVFANSASEWAFYSIPLTTVGSFDSYSVPVGSPTLSTGGFDPTSVKAVAMYVDGSGFPNLDVRVSDFDITCEVPEASTWMAMLGLGGLMGLSWARVRAARSR
jgi:hypothetical protein